MASMAGEWTGAELLGPLLSGARWRHRRDWPVGGPWPPLLEGKSLSRQGRFGQHLLGGTCFGRYLPKLVREALRSPRPALLGSPRAQEDRAQGRG